MFIKYKCSIGQSKVRRTKQKREEMPLSQVKQGIDDVGGDDDDDDLFDDGLFCLIQLIMQTLHENFVEALGTWPVRHGLHKLSEKK